MMMEDPVRYHGYSWTPKLITANDKSRRGGLYWPFAVAIDNAGHFHVGYIPNKRICKYDHCGKYVSSYDVGSEPRGMCTTVKGDICIARQDHRLSVCDDSGLVLDTVGRQGCLAGEFDHPCGVAVDGEGLVYVCDTGNQRVQVMDLSRTGAYQVVRIVGAAGAGALGQPISVAVHPNSGHIYVVDQEENHVKIYDREGAYSSCLETNDTPCLAPWHVAFSAYGGGLLAISDTQNDRVHILRDGVHLQELGGHGRGGFRAPWGITFTKSGDVVVCDKNNDRVQVFGME